jgi:hypothetical protein
MRPSYSCSLIQTGVVRAQWVKRYTRIGRPVLGPSRSVGTFHAICQDCLWDQLSLLFNLHRELFSLTYRRPEREPDRPSYDDLAGRPFSPSYTSVNIIVSYAELKDNEVGSVDSHLPCPWYVTGYRSMTLVLRLIAADGRARIDHDFM